MFGSSAVLHSRLESLHPLVIDVAGLPLPFPDDHFSQVFDHFCVDLDLFIGVFYLFELFVLILLLLFLLLVLLELLLDLFNFGLFVTFVALFVVLVEIEGIFESIQNLIYDDFLPFVLGVLDEC